MKNNLSSNVYLSNEERSIVDAAVSKVSFSELMSIKHMAERQILLPEKAVNSLWLFYLPDFTVLFKDFYRCYIEYIFEVYRPCAQASLQWDDQFLLLKYNGERPKEIVQICQRGELLTMGGYLLERRRYSVFPEHYRKPSEAISALA